MYGQRNRSKINENRVDTWVWKGSSDGMRYGNTNDSNSFMEFRTMVVREFRAFKSWHNRLLRGERKWPLRLHYSMWVTIAIVIVFMGALNEGRKELLQRKAEEQGMAKGVVLFFETTTLKQWGDIKI